MNQKPKLLIVADTYYPKIDGTLRFIEEFTQRATKFFDISYLVPFFGEKRGEEVTYVSTMKHFSLSGYAPMRLTFGNFSKIKQAVKNADIVFVQGPALLSLLAVYYARRYKKKAVFFMHTVLWELYDKFAPKLIRPFVSFFFKRWGLRAFNKCHTVLVPYIDLVKELRRYGVQVPIRIARLGVAIDKFKPSLKSAAKQALHLRSDTFVVGYVGRISKEKNVSVLLDAFSRLEEQSSAHLLLIGDGTKEQVKACTRLKNCTVTGFVPNVHNYLRAVDVFVMPSLTETTSLATLEAMATGIPVVVTKVGFMQHYIVKQKNGLFFPRNNPVFLAKQLSRLRDNPEFAQNLAKQARTTVAYGFSWERSINRIVKLLLDEFYTP